MTDTSFNLVHTLNDNQIHQLCTLYRGEWWTRNRLESDVRTMLRNTSLFFAMIDSAKNDLAAFARVLTDGVYKAILFDVIVAPNHRHKGLGRRLMDAVVQHPVLNHVETIELYCLPEMAPLYAKWGFSTDCAGCVFLRRPRNA